MPIISGPPAVVVTGTSSDGVVAAETRSYASVGVTVNWTAAAGAVPWRTTVTRRSGGVTVNVRSGDLAYTPGGAGYVYDHEAPLDGQVTYQAYGYDPLGALVRTSTPVTLTLPTLPAASKLWLKAVNHPTLSLQLYGSVVAERVRRVETFDVPGQPSGPRWVDVLSTRRGTLRVVTVSGVERDSLRDLLEEGDLLVQAPAAQGMPDMFLTVTAEKESPVGPRGNTVTRWELAFSEGTRPSTVGSPLRIPGWTNDAVLASYSSYSALDAAFPTYLARAKGP